jgi:hypothetical protein
MNRSRVVAATGVLAAVLAGLAVADLGLAGKTKKFATDVEITKSIAYGDPHPETGQPYPGQVDGVVDSKNAKCVSGRLVTAQTADASGNPDPFPSNIPGDETNSKGRFSIPRGPSGTGPFPKLRLEVEGKRAGNVACKTAKVVVP